MRLVGSRESDVSCARMSLWTHFRPLDHPKMRLGWGWETSVSRTRIVPANYFGLWDKPKCNYGELKKVTPLVVARHFEQIFCPLASQKCHLDEVEKAMFQVVEWHFEIIFCFLTNRKCNFLQVDKATIQVAEWVLKVIICLLTIPKFDFFEVKKAMFQVFPRHWEIIFPLDQPKMRLWWSRESDVSSGHMTLWTHFRPLDHPKMLLVWGRKSYISRSRMEI